MSVLPCLRPLRLNESTHCCSCFSAPRKQSFVASSARLSCSTAIGVTKLRAIRRSESVVSRIDVETLALLISVLPLYPSAAIAEEFAPYDPSSQAEFITNVAGVLYCGLVIYLLYKVFVRRAKKFTSERIASEASDKVEEDPELQEPVAVSPVGAFIGAAQALGIAAALWVLCGKIDGFMSGQALPDQYTARNIAITVRTAISGLSYLATFFFAANGLGLTALGFKLLIFGDDEEPKAAIKPVDELPKISWNSDYEDIVKAFDEAAKQPEKKP